MHIFSYRIEVANLAPVRWLKLWIQGIGLVVKEQHMMCGLYVLHKFELYH